MNRVLSWPSTRMIPGLLDGLMVGRHTTRVTERGSVRFDVSLGEVEMRFCNPHQQLPPGTEVLVWWKGGGFVCASSAEFDSEERASRHIADCVNQARSRLAAARRERQAKPAPQVDIVLPIDSEPLRAARR